MENYGNFLYFKMKIGISNKASRIFVLECINVLKVQEKFACVLFRDTSAYTLNSYISYRP